MSSQQVEVRSPSDLRLMPLRNPDQAVWVESDRIDECMDLLQRQNLAGIAISPLGGFGLGNLEFLRRFPKIKSLTVLHSELIDISAINELRELAYLHLGGQPKQAIDLNNFPLLRELRVVYWPGLRFNGLFRSLRTLSIAKYKPKIQDLSGLPALPALENLELVQSPLKSIDGISALRGLKRFAAFYMPKLAAIAPLAAARPQYLEELHLDHCRKISDHEAVRSIKPLRVLRFNHCGQIPSLEFLHDLSGLADFSFVGTQVLDGDLRPCLRIPSVGFTDHAKYTHRYSQFSARIKAAGPNYRAT